MTTTPDAPIRKKLIEVSIPLEDINSESAREKSIRHGHPSTLHLWWARRPLAAARAVLFAQLVDDPSSDPSLTEEEQKAERERLHGIIRRLVKWENVNDEGLLREAHDEILKSTGGNPPAILDPFAGGGTIPLEAQRLGLEAHASDLNPVAVLINKALIEIPPKFAGRPPVFPGAADTKLGEWPRATGLAEDVRRYGAWMRDEAKKRIGHLYPDALLVDERTGKPIIDLKTGEQKTATTIAWIWARTVTCPNPACGIEMPLVRSWWLGKKKGKEAYVVPTVVNDAEARGGRRVEFTIGHDTRNAPPKTNGGTIAGGTASCVACQSPASAAYLRAYAQEQGLGSTLIAIVSEGNRRRIYTAPTFEQISASVVERPPGTPDQLIPTRNHDVDRLPMYGMPRWSDAFTNRQLTALTTFSDLVGEAREIILKDALASGLPGDARLADGGSGAEAYADAVVTYLGVVVSRLTDYQSAITTWASNPQMEILRNVFARQAIPMAWDFAEGNPFGPSSGTLEIMISAVSKAVDALPTGSPAIVSQADASSRDYSDVAVSTDPPYYDNIGYSDLSDFFYVWLRRALRDVHPSVFASVLVPKDEELVANPYRHGGKDGAARFFEAGFERVFAHARESASDEFPITVYYAFKQQELEKEGTTSTGWATLLEGMIRSGWTITATWPVRSERSGRMISVGTNALASSIVLSLRPRHESAGAASRRGFISALHQELPQALYEMQQGSIAPVDLAQSTIGPGMAIFSRYSQVIENDGKPMSVKSALALINEVLDQVLAEKEGDFDPDTRFCLKWYQQFGWDKAPYGEADVLARAVDTSVAGLKDAGVLTSREGTVQLTRPADLPQAWNPVTDDRISIWEVTCHLARTLISESGGIEPAARLMAMAGTRVDLEAVQLLSYRLYELTQHTRPDDARMFNALGSTWAELSAAAGVVDLTVAKQGDLDLGLGL